MYKNLADAAESLKENGYTHTFELGDGTITCSELDTRFKADELDIVESHPFDQGTDPGSESTIHAIKSKSGVKGTLIISYGKYADRDKARLIDKLLNH